MKIMAGIRNFRLRVHYKLGLSVFVTIVLLLIALEIIFYVVFTRSYVQQLADDMIHRGHSHAYALQENWSEDTLRHVAEMEMYSRYVVAVIGENGEVLVSSSPLEQEQMNYVRDFQSHMEYAWVERDWRNEPYLVSQSPVFTQSGEEIGNVLMFAPTIPIRDAVQSFRALLLIFTAGAILSVLVLVFLFSLWFSKPLLLMTNAIRRLARNDYYFSLPTHNDDEIGELNRSIMELSAELKHYRTEREQFLAEISHELRTPITYIRGYADVLQKQSLLEADRNKYLQFIYDAAGRLHRLIGDLYELTKLDQIEVSIRKEKIDLTSVLQQIVEESHHRFETAGIHFHIELPHYPVVMQGDASRIVQVIMNVLENARIYTSKGGHVTLRGYTNKDGMRIEVDDNGIGIPEGELPHIWRRFYRVEKSRSRDYGGSGLGLAIARRIVHLHDGSIEAQSKEGEGTTFIIQLPLHTTND
jgi:two-component system sensor histidine kinase BaeS